MIGDGVYSLIIRRATKGAAEKEKGMQIRKQIKRMGKTSTEEWEKFYRDNPDRAKRQSEERARYSWAIRK